MPPAASFSNIARRVGSAKARKMSFSIMQTHKHTLMRFASLFRDGFSATSRRCRAAHADPLILRHEPNDGIDVFIVPRRLFHGKAPLLLTRWLLGSTTWRSTEVPSARSAQQRFDFTSTQPRSTVIALMFDPPTQCLYASRRWPFRRRLVAKTTHRAVEKDRAFW
jgi:hypothetical protein